MPFPPVPESPHRRLLSPEQPPRTHRGGGTHLPPSSFPGRSSAVASGSGTPRVGMHLFTKPRNHHGDGCDDDDDVSVLTFSTVTTGKNSHARSYVENLAKESLEKVMSGGMEGALERDEEEDNEDDREDDLDDRGRILTRLSEEGSSSQGGSSSEITRRSAAEERCDRGDGRSSDKRKRNDAVEKGREHAKEKEGDEEEDDDDDDDTLSLAESVLSNANEVLMKLSASPYAKNIRNKHNTNAPQRNLLPPPSTSTSSSSPSPSSFAVANVTTSSPYKKTNILGDAKKMPRESPPNPHVRDKYLAAATNIYSPTTKTSRIGDTHSFWNRWNDENISRASNHGDSNDRGGKNDRNSSFASSKSLSPSKSSAGSASNHRYNDNVKDYANNCDNRKTHYDNHNNTSKNNNNNNNNNNNSRTSFLFETNNDHSDRSTHNHTSRDGDILQRKSSTITMPKLRDNDDKLKRLQAEKKKCQRELEECQSKSKEATNALDASIARAKLLLEKMMMGKNAQSATTNTTAGREEVTVRDGGVVSC